MPEKEAFRLMDIYQDAGGNCLDTARVYASWLPGGDGASEVTIGKWLKTRGCRNKTILSTKGGHPSFSSMNCGRLSRKEIEGDLDESLKALGVDYIDIYWLHRDDVSRPVEDIAETMTALIKKGKIRAAGCSNWRSDRIEELNEFAAKNDMEPFAASQIQWSLAASTPEDYNDSTLVCMDEKEYNWYLEKQFPVFAFSSQAKGFFTKLAKQGLEGLSQKAYSRFATSENLSRFERVKKYADERGLTVSAVALGYITENRFPAFAIIGPSSSEQLEDSLTAADVSIPHEIIDWLYKG
jgi:aryl-alcohol dehydrogenase-like predicted oxidoreductase